MKLGLIMAVVGSAAACSTDEVDYTLGSQERLEFSHSVSRPVGDECFIDCAIDRPLLAGATTIIKVYPHTDERLPFLRAASSDRSVLSLVTRTSTCCNYSCMEGDHYDACLARGESPRYQVSIEATGAREGTAHLVLYSPTDPLYDELLLTVRRAGSLELQTQPDRERNDYDFETVDELRLTGRDAKIRVVAHDRAGNRLFASNGIEISLEGDVAERLGPDNDSAYVTIQPKKRGTGTLRATSGDATLELPIVSQ